MFTPQEVSEHAFAKASFGGYNMAMVDEFLDQLTADYTALYKENASLKAKMKVLADSLEEYRATEKGMRRALLAAQQAADEMVKDTPMTYAYYHNVIKGKSPKAAPTYIAEEAKKMRLILMQWWMPSVTAIWTAW